MCFCVSVCVALHYQHMPSLAFLIVAHHDLEVKASAWGSIFFEVCVAYHIADGSAHIIASLFTPADP